MTYSLRFLPEVEEDVFAGYKWYANKALGVGKEFLEIFYAHLSEISSNPLLYPKVYNGFRRCLLKKFPYAIYFMTEDNDIIVFGLFHCARNPDTIKTNLQYRNEQ
ncbi:MAG: type II toxin-antitoxin system RelE/ParE family toxin [Nitrospirae bacterium]|nr:type II toxin-antitoxin system RelE/ParE family toxin [Nitrospirota bacterium]MBF0593125.1 type II toxin-antitoxin system RelE/ParE family toxin [Nitrospirota bacterium]